MLVFRLNLTRMRHVVGLRRLHVWVYRSGVVANRRPDLYRVMLLKVPFLDVLTSMLDDSLPLTVHEYDEWGNPSDSEQVYAYIRNYSPYDNVKEQVCVQ